MKILKIILSSPRNLIVLMGIVILFFIDFILNVFVIPFCFFNRQNRKGNQTNVKSNKVNMEHEQNATEFYARLELLRECQEDLIDPKVPESMKKIILKAVLS